jgi:hypothetical protein
LRVEHLPVEEVQMRVDAAETLIIEFDLIAQPR